MGNIPPHLGYRECLYVLVTINEDYFDELLNDALFLSILESHGVDNWDGYSEAQAEHYSDDEEE